MGLVVREALKRSQIRENVEEIVRGFQSNGRWPLGEEVNGAELENLQ